MSGIITPAPLKRYRIKKNSSMQLRPCYAIAPEYF